jgi:3-hydroxyisobutyrate dehydrogenase-like beta-hydroxyacid dehydrogenase
METSLQSGMIGLGNMGGRMARRVRDAGLPIAGFDVDADQAARSGIDAVGSIGELVRAVGVVFFSLPDSRVIEKVVYGEGGVLSSCREGQIVVDLSTAAPASSVRIHADLHERGIAFLDAGISGGAAAADAGTLTIMAGGDASALATATPILETFASRVYHMGAPGSGHTAKLLNNFLNGISLAATAEAMVAARKAGLDLAQFLDVVNHSSGVNFATLNRFPRIIEGDYLEGGLTSNLMAKDLMLYLQFVQAIGVTSFTGPSCLGTFHLAAALGYGDQISNRVVDAIGDVAGGVRVNDGAAAPAGVGGEA